MHKVSKFKKLTKQISQVLCFHEYISVY